MPGALAWGYYPTDKIWLPIQVDANGCIKADMTAINLDDLADVSVAAPTDGYILYWDAATSLWKCKAIPAAAWAAITGKPTSPSLEELATEHDASGLHAGMVLDNIGDVSVAAPTDGYVLYWDAATSLWKCKAVSGMVVHGNEYHYPDYEEVGVAAGLDAYLVAKSLYDAYSILMATEDNTPIALTVAQQTLIGRITGGAIASLTVAQVKALLDWAADITTHAALTTGMHGVGSNYLAYTKGSQKEALFNNNYMAKAYLSAEQSNLTSGAITKVLLNTENYDPGNNFNTVTSKYVAPVAGYYLVMGVVVWSWVDMVVDKEYYTLIYKNGALYLALSLTVSVKSNAGYLVTTLIHLAATDYIELYAVHYAGNNVQDIMHGVDRTSLTIALYQAD